MSKVKFSGVIVGTKFRFHGIEFMKTNYISTNNKRLYKCKSNCINLSNNHKCVISDNAIVEV